MGILQQIYLIYIKNISSLQTDKMENFDGLFGQKLAE